MKSDDPTPKCQPLQWILSTLGPYLLLLCHLSFLSFPPTSQMFANFRTFVPAGPTIWHIRLWQSCSILPSPDILLHLAKVSYSSYLKELPSPYCSLPHNLYPLYSFYSHCIYLFLCLCVHYLMALPFTPPTP